MAYEQLLFDVGYRATTIRAVAERAGVSPELIYKAFGGKPGLLKALWDVTLAGDDEPVAMGRRRHMHEIWATTDPRTKLNLYAGFVRSVHERLAKLHAMLVEAGPEAAEVLSISEQERLSGVATFVTHLADIALLRGDVDRTTATDACWALTAAEVFNRLTADRGWTGDAYQSWLAEMLCATVLPLHQT